MNILPAKVASCKHFRRNKIIAAISLCCITFLMILRTRNTVIEIDAAHHGNQSKPTPYTCSSISLSSMLHVAQRSTFVHSDGAQGHIPMMVHYTYKDLQLPQQYEPLVRHCIQLNPNVTFILWTDSMAERMVQQLQMRSGNILPRGGEPSFLSILQSYDGIERSDVFRIMLMYYLGGVYMDLDMECRKPLRQFFLEKVPRHVNCIVDQEEFIQSQIVFEKKYLLMNNLFMCQPRHEFFQFLMEHLKPSKLAAGNDPVTKTGPLMLTSNYHEYLQMKNESSKLQKSSILLAHPWWFSPTVDSVDWLKKLCAAPLTNFLKRRACLLGLSNYKATLSERLEKAYMRHQFLHLGYSWAKTRITNRFPVCHTLNNIHLPLI